MRLAAVMGSQTWIHHGRRGAEILTLRRLPFRVGIGGALNQSSSVGRIGPFVLPNVRFLERRLVTLCGDSRGFYTKTETALAKHAPAIMETVMANTTGGSFVASYSRPASTPADAGAEAAIFELCPVTPPSP